MHLAIVLTEITEILLKVSLNAITPDPFNQIMFIGGFLMSNYAFITLHYDWVSFALRNEGSS